MRDIISRGHFVLIKNRAQTVHICNGLPFDNRERGKTDKRKTAGRGAPQAAVQEKSVRPVLKGREHFKSIRL